MAERTSKLPARAPVTSLPSINIAMRRASAFQGVSAVLGRITEGLQDEADREAILRATREGTIAGAAGTPELTKESTLAGKAFDTAARQSYTNRTEMAVRVNLNAFAEQHKTNPSAYTKAASGYLTGVVQEMGQIDPAVAAVMGEKFKLDIASQTQSIAKVQSRLLAQERKADAIVLTDQIRKDLSNITPDLVSGSPEKGMEALERINIERGRLEAVLAGSGPDGLPLFGASDVATSLLKFDQDVFQQVAREWVRGQPDKVEALEAIENGTAEIEVAFVDEDGETEGTEKRSITENLLPEEKEKLVAFANRQVTAENKATQRRLQSSAGEVADLEIAIDNGTADLDDIAQAQEDGLFVGREQKRATLTKAWQTRQEQKRKGEIDLTRVTDAINGELTLDPGNADDKKAVDGYWDATTRQLAIQTEGMPEDQAEAVEKTLGVNLVRRTGMVPKSMKGQIVGAMRSGTTEQRISAADTIDRLNQLPGNVLAAEMSKSDIALGLQISSLVRAGQDPEQAVEAALLSTNPTNTPVIEARKETIRIEDFSDGYEGVVTDHFNPTTILDFIPFGPDDDAELTTVDGTKSRVIADYKVLFEDWFTRTGDEDQAKEQALKDLGRVWGVTRADGNVRVMKYAPEAFYGVGVDDGDWMKSQLTADIQAIRPKAKADDIMLGSDNTTAREAKAGRPTYPVLIKTPSGAFEPLRLDDNLVRWSPDSGETKRKLIKGKIDAAKDRRQEKISADAIEPGILF
jgi:hypothetical protein